MKAFHFRLNHLLGLRQQEEELGKLKLGQASRICEEIRLSLDEVRLQQVRSAQAGSTADFMVRQAWLHRLTRERQTLEQQAREAEARRQVVLGEYVESRKKAEVLRKLKERHFAEYRSEALREQEAVQDDLVQSRLVIRQGQAARQAVKEGIQWHS